MQKILFYTLSSLLLVSCGKAKTLSSEESLLQRSSESACYLGVSSSECFNLVYVKPSDLGYLDPYKDPSFTGVGKKSQYRPPVRAINLKSYSQNLLLSPLFKIKDFMSLNKGQMGVFSPKVVQALNDIKAKHPLQINSAYRSPKYNSTIPGAAKWSRHIFGDAVDISSNKLSLNQIVQLCRDYGSDYQDKYTNHVHCDWRRSELPEAFFGALTEPQKEEVETSYDFSFGKIRERSDLKIRGNVKSGEIISLKFEEVEKDDPEPLYKKWTIYLPGRSEPYILEQDQVLLLLEKGSYKIFLEVGEHFQTQYEFAVLD